MREDLIIYETIFSQKKNRVINSNRRVIRCDSYYPENFSDLGFEGLDSAIEALQRLVDSADTLSAFIEDVKYRANDTDKLEWFDGPDNAYAFGQKINSIASNLNRLYDSAWNIVDKYSNL